MENLKKILNAQTPFFSNFQFSQHMAGNHLAVHKLYPNSRYRLIPC